MRARHWTLPQVAKLAGVEYRTAHVWLRRGMFSPTVHRSTGTGNPSLFSDEDVERVRHLAALRALGLEPDALGRAGREPRALRGELGVHLSWLSRHNGFRDLPEADRTTAPARTPKKAASG